MKKFLLFFFISLSIFGQRLDLLPTTTTLISTDRLLVIPISGSSAKIMTVANWRTNYMDTAFVRIATQQYITGKKVFMDSVSLRKNFYSYGSNNFYLDNTYNSASRILFDGAFRLTGRDTALQDYIYSKTVSGVRHLYWRRDNTTPIKLDSIGTSGAFDSTKAWTMLGNWQFNKNLQFGAYGVFRLPARDTTTISAALYRTGASDEYIAFNYNAIGGIDTLMSWAKARATYESKFTTLGISKGGTNATAFTAGKYIYFNGTKLISSAKDSTSFNLQSDTTGLAGRATRNFTTNTYEPKITAGTTAQYWRGDKSWQTLNAAAVGLGNVTNNAQIYSLNSLTAQTQTFAIGTSGTAPNWSSITSTHTLNIPMAATTSVTAGLISKTEYDTFNAKEAALTFSYPLSRSVNTISLGYNTTNLQLTANQLNTIQGIATSSSPTFAGLTAINGTSNTQTILPLTKYTYNLGALSNKFLTLHAAELWVETLVAQNTIATIGGRILVGRTNTLIADLTDVATTIDVKYNNFVNGDRVYMEANGSIEFIAIASTASVITGGYRYTVTRNLDGSGANAWNAGDAIFDTGTTGDGFIDLYSVQGLKGSSQAGPAIVGNIRNSATYNDFTEHWAIGNLYGLYGYGAVNTYGVGLGKYATGETNVTVDATNGFRIRNYTTTLGQWADDGTITVGEVGIAKSNIIISSNAVKLRNNITDKLVLNTDGSITLGEVGAGKNNILINADSLSLRTNTTSNITLASGGTGYFRGNITSTATITGGTIQTATGTGQRVVISGATNDLKWYDSSNNNTIKIGDNVGGTQNGMLITNGLIYATGVLPTGFGMIEARTLGTGINNYAFYAYAINGTNNYSFYGAAGTLYNAVGMALGASKFIVNDTGQLTKVNNISPTAKYTLIGDGTSFTPRLLAMSDLPALTANRVLLSDASGYVSASSVTNTTLGYLDATSSIQTQINGKTSLASVVAATNTWAAPQTFSSSTKRTALVLTSITSNTIDTYSTVEYSYIQLNVTGGGTLTYINYNSGNPTDGTELIITNVNATAVTLTEDTTNNAMRLGGASVTLNQWESIHLIYAVNGANKRWSKIK